MKAIVHISKTGKSPVPLLRHVYRKHSRDGDEIDCEDRVVGIVNGLDCGVPGRNAPEDTKLLLQRHHSNKARAIRHVIISLQDTRGKAGRLVAFKALVRLCQDFIREFAPGADYLGIIHQDKNHPHLHLILSNSDGERCYDWSPKTLKKMQDIPIWSKSPQVTSGRGKGLVASGPGPAVYPKSQNLVAGELAEIVFGEVGGFERLTESGILTAPRKDKSGKTISLAYKGKRIRISTLERVALAKGLTLNLPVSGPNGPPI